MTTIGNETGLASGALSESELGVFDITALAAITIKNPAQHAALVGMVTNIVNTGRDELALAQRYYSEGNAAEAAKLVHGLRGGLGSLGAKRFAKETIALEEALLLGTGDVSACFDTAVTELSKTLAMAQAWLAQQRG